MIPVDPGLREPAPELRAGATAEGLAGRQLDRARCLAHDRDAVANGPCDNGTGSLEIAAGDAFRARADLRMKSLESSITVRLILQ